MMRTLRHVLAARRERENLRHVGICVALTVALVAVAFGLVTVKHLVETGPNASWTLPTVAGTNASQLESADSGKEAR